MASEIDAQDTAQYIPFDEFRSGLPQGRLRGVVNPKLAAPFVADRSHATPRVRADRPGHRRALAGHPRPVGLLVAAAIVLRWSVKTQAPRLLLHWAARVPPRCEQATEHGVMEVRRA